MQDSLIVRDDNASREITVTDASPDPDRQDVMQLIASEIPGMRRYARRLEHHPEDAEDLVQDALERALRKRHSWRGGNLAVWLRRIAFTVFANRHARPQREEADILVDGALATATPPRQEERLACRDIAHAVRDLPREQRRAVNLALRPGYSYEENADAADMPVGTFRSRLSRAREKLRTRLGPPQGQAAHWQIG
jgi:RNA polymerase sigma-70 factor (ECF subfamily)